MLTDKQLQNNVLAELDWAPDVAAAHLGVSARDGIVTLSGQVGSYAEKHAAETAVRHVHGVKGVAEAIEVLLPFDRQRTDAEIAAAVIDRLAWDVSVPHDALTVVVEHGQVTIGGDVEWHYERDAAEQDIRRLMGVTGVVNRIEVRPTTTAEQIGDDITHALHRSYFFDPKTIAVTAVDGRVELTGSVKSWNDWETAAATAWGAPGVRAVDNRITII
ncbi:MULTISPECIES: BON domain-containing protein [Sphingosinicellaceae]|uniref:BON domain-containing protein n=1 Tax=Sphingosinicellaceae TaxID=2820280 RepID=UPI001C1E3AB6|nr:MULTISPECIES: BON domain-containing protein [Polymorphobacter]QYE33491.1 BON domain-containing protein [Polymorphobacter sp. PAMC 29334]UAJ12854.1 BON domain-containing protein [Polymorphobacter megasporae]